MRCVPNLFEVRANICNERIARFVFDNFSIGGKACRQLKASLVRKEIFSRNIGLELRVFKGYRFPKLLANIIERTVDLIGTTSC